MLGVNKDGQVESLKPKGEPGKTQKPGAWKKDPKLMDRLQKQIPLGSLVTYTGSRVKETAGKTGVVIGYRDANGLSVEFKGGLRGTISIPKTRVVRVGPAPKKEKGETPKPEQGGETPKEESSPQE